MTADGSVTRSSHTARSGQRRGRADAGYAARRENLRLSPGGYDGARAERGTDGHHRHHRLHAGRHPGAVRADPARDSRRGRCARACARVRHQPSHERLGCDPDQRHGLARAGLRRCLGRAGWAPLGTRDGAYLCARRAAEGFGQAGAGGLRHRRRDRGAPVACGQFSSLRQRVAPHGHARYLRSRGSGLASSRARRCAHRQGAGACGFVLVRHQGELRHHDEAAARRPCRAQRLVRGADRRARLRVRTPARSSTSRVGSRSSMAGATTGPSGCSRTGALLGRSSRPRTVSSSFPAAARRIRPLP